MPKSWTRPAALLATAALVAGGAALTGGGSAAGTPAGAAFGAAVDPHPAPLHPDRSAPFRADQVVQLLKQPGGYAFRARMTDPKVGGLFETVAGYGVERDSTQTWHYINGLNGRGEVMLGAVVTAGRPPSGLAKHLGRHHVDLSPAELAMRETIGKQLDSMARQFAPQARRAAGPRLFKVPALMLQTWYDEAKGETAPTFHEGTDTPEYFEKLLDGFGGNPMGSVTQYYYEASFGQFLVQIDVYGTYTSLHSQGDPCYYGTPDAGTVRVQDPVGGELGLGGLGGVGMASEAVPQTVAVPWAKYDNDGDGVVDFTMIIHSGGGHEVTGDKCNTHSHQISVSSLANIGTSALGINAETLKVGIPTPTPGESVDRILTIPEFESADSPLTIGVAAHEMAHALGEPDYYDTGYTSVGTGDFDIMSGGSYLGNPSGSNPAMQNPATRVFQHYVTPTIVHKSLHGYRLEPRTAMPRKGYRHGQPDRNLLLVPTYERAVGEKDKLGHVWTANDVYGLARDPKTKKYVVEGYYVENVSRNATSAKIETRNPMGSMFDRQQHASGLAVWHFDYWRQSTTYFGGANDAQSDPNRYQMDLEEFDQNDNTQELQLNLARGNPADLLTPAATGITSGTRMLPPGPKPGDGAPQKPIEISGTTTLVTPGMAEFTVDRNPANESMQVDIASDLSGDCKLQLIDPQGNPGTEVDSGGPGDGESITVKRPMPGTWTAKVSEFAACASWSGRVVFAGGRSASFSTYGAADTWSNWSHRPTGWAFTSVRGYGNGLDESQEGGAGTTSLTLDVLNLSKAKDVSPGFVAGRRNAQGGTSTLNAGRTNHLQVPVFSNGGKAPGRVSVAVHRDGIHGPVVTQRTVRLDAYQRRYVGFTVKPRSEGPLRLVAVVDPQHRIHEGSEGNQVQVTNLWVGPTHPHVLIVDDDQTLAHERAIQGALAGLGVRYATYGAHPTYQTLKRYRAVIWSTGVDRYEGQLNAADRSAIRRYLDGGGRLMITGNRILDDLTTQGSPMTPADQAEFGAHYFGVRTPQGNTTYIVSQSGPVNLKGKALLRKLKRVRVNPAAARQFVGLAGVTSAGKGALGTVIKPFGKAAGIVVPPAALLGAVHKEQDRAYVGVGVQGDDKHHHFKTVVLGWNLGDDANAGATEHLLKTSLHFFGVSTHAPLQPARRLVYTSAVRDWVSGRSATVTAVVLGGRGETRPTVHYRRHARGRFYVARMHRAGGPGAWAFTIPGRAITPNGLDYYIAAGSAKAPYGGQGGPLYFSIASAIPEVRGQLPIKH